MLKENILKVINEYNMNVAYYISDFKKDIYYNQERIYEGASCMKVFILLEFFNQVYKEIINQNEYIEYSKEDNIEGINFGIIHNLSYGTKFKLIDLAKIMIIYSDNIATNKLIDKLGIENINKTIKDYGFNNTILHNELNLLKYYKFGSTTIKDYALFLKKVYQEKLINKKISNNILEILKLQENSDMIYKGLNQIDVLLKGTDESQINYIASKSGTIIYTGSEMTNLRNDGGIVSTKNGDYIICIFIDNVTDLQFNYDNLAIELGGKIGKLVYNNFVENKGVFND